jgi:hypothetical protein
MEKEALKALIFVSWVLNVIKLTELYSISPTIQKKCYKNGVLELATSSPTHKENWSIILK